MRFFSNGVEWEWIAMKLRTGEPWMPAPDYGRSLKALTINLRLRTIDMTLQFQREVAAVSGG